MTRWSYVLSAPRKRYWKGKCEGEVVGIQPYVRTCVFVFSTPHPELGKMIITPIRLCWKKKK